MFDIYTGVSAECAHFSGNSQLASVERILVDKILN